jgi:hypothetical protein
VFLGGLNVVELDTVLLEVGCNLFGLCGSYLHCFVAFRLPTLILMDCLVFVPS